MLTGTPATTVPNVLAATATVDPSIKLIQDQSATLLGRLTTGDEVPEKPPGPPPEGDPQSGSKPPVFGGGDA